MSATAIAVHGGAGGIPGVPRRPSPNDEVRRRTLARALSAGHEVLTAGRSALDAVIAAVIVLEDCESLNAGRGSVLRADGTAVMDAALMDGRDGGAGAVAGVRTIRNPILAARAVLEDTPHVLLLGEGAARLAERRGLAMESESYFITDARRGQLERLQERNQIALDHDSEDAFPGTVGAVARDREGHLAAATSTGGMTNAMPFRVGDTPIIGAGTWAADATCAISATGDGEAFIRSAFAHEIDARIRLGGLDLGSACHAAFHGVRACGGEGGAIAVAPAGEAFLGFTTSAMPRGRAGADGVPHVALNAGEPLRTL